MKIALVIKTDGLEYDDRVRKEIQSIQKLYPDITFKIFVMLPENVEREGVTSYGIAYKYIYIPARDKYASAQKIVLKEWQFYCAVKKDIIAYDIVWVADMHAVFVPLFLRHKRILWDLHELPLLFCNNSLKRVLLRYIFNRCNVIIHANPQREQYLESIGIVKNPAKHFVLRNFPNFEEEDNEHDELYYSFVKWKGNRICVYLQGLQEETRAPFESISAVLSLPDICAVVIGNFDTKSKERLIEAYGKHLNDRILFIGKIPQLKIPQYIKHCYTSLIFYKNVNPNNYYCEANRFYQSIILGLPVVVGNNPPMKELVSRYGVGISINDDGRNVTMIANGLKKVIDNYDYYHRQTIKNRHQMMWNQQENIIRDIIDNIRI